MDNVEAGQIISLAIGRLFRMGSRPFEEEDVKTFYKIRTAVMEAGEVLGLTDPQYELNYASQHSAGRVNLGALKAPLKTAGVRGCVAPPNKGKTQKRQKRNSKWREGK